MNFCSRVFIRIVEFFFGHTYRGSELNVNNAKYLLAAGRFKVTDVCAFNLSAGWYEVTLRSNGLVLTSVSRWPRFQGIRRIVRVRVRDQFVICDANDVVLLKTKYGRGPEDGPVVQPLVSAVADEPDMPEETPPVAVADEPEQKPPVEVAAKPTDCRTGDCRGCGTPVFDSSCPCCGQENGVG